jgi:MFS family permease
MTFSRSFYAFLHLRFYVATGWHMQSLVVGYYLYSLTRDPFVLALVGIAEALPAIGGALPLGYVVERLNKRSAIIGGVSIIIASALGTALLLLPSTLGTLGPSTVLYGMLAMITINGFARALYSPAMFSTLGRLVERDSIARASALSSTVWQSAMIAGPLVGGLMFGYLGAEVTAFSIVCIMVFGSLGALFLPSMPAIRLTSTSNGMMRDVTMGLRFIFSNRVILGALSLDLFAVLFGGVVALLPAFAADVLFVDERGLGLLRASMSIGSVAMMAVLSWKPIGRSAGTIMLAAVAGFGGCILGFASSTSFTLSVICLMCAGAFDSVSVVVRHTVLQLYTPEDMKGRVAAANTMFISSSNELGAVESGLAARLFGIVPSVYIGGVMTLLVVAVIWCCVPKLRSLTLESEKTT